MISSNRCSRFHELQIAALVPHEGLPELVEETVSGYLSIPSKSPKSDHEVNKAALEGVTFVLRQPGLHGGTTTTNSTSRA